MTGGGLFGNIQAQAAALVNARLQQAAAAAGQHLNLAGGQAPGAHPNNVANALAFAQAQMQQAQAQAQAQARQQAQVMQRARQGQEEETVDLNANAEEEVGLAYFVVERAVMVHCNFCAVRLPCSSSTAYRLRIVFCTYM